MTKHLARVLTLLMTVGVPAWGQAPIPVGDEFQVNTYTTEAQSHPAVALDRDGGFVVVWQSNTQDGSSWGVHAQRYDPVGTPLGDEFQVNTYTTDEQRRPSVAANPDGKFVVLWTSYSQDGSYNSVQAQRFNADGTPLATEFQINTYTSENQAQSSVATAADGLFVATWASYRQDDSGWSVQAQRYDSDGMTLAGEFQVNTHTDSHQHYPNIALDPAGNFVIVWQSLFQDGDGNGIFGQRYDSHGLLLGNEFQVNTYTTNNQKFPDVAMADDGSFVVVWKSLDQDGSEYGIHGQRFDSSGALVGMEFQANTYTTSQQVDPAVAALTDSSFLVVWTGAVPNGNTTDARWYDPSGVAPNEPFRVDSVLSGGRSLAAVASAENQNLVVAWTSSGIEGSSTSVHARRLVTPIFVDGF